MAYNLPLRLPWQSFYQKKVSPARSGIEPGTSWLDSRLTANNYWDATAKSCPRFQLLV